MTRISKKPDRKTLLGLLGAKTNSDVASELGVAVKTVQRWRDSYGLSHEVVQTKGLVSLNSFQKDLVTAWLLGDGSIPCSKVGQKNRFSFKQKLDRKEYVQFVYETLKPFSSNIKDSKPKPGPTRCKKTGKISQYSGENKVETSMQTIRASTFQELRQKWYAEPYNKKSPKIVPNLVFNWRIFSFWFADDGNNNAARKVISMATQSFSDNDVDKLIVWLKRDLGLHGFRKKGPVLVFRVNQYELILEKLRINLGFLDCLRSKLNSTWVRKMKYKSKILTDERIEAIWQDKLSYLHPKEICEKHKITRSTYYTVVKNKSLELSKKLPVMRKLNEAKILNIVEMWNNGVTQREIGDKFGINQTMVSQILRGKSHAEITKGIHIRGQQKEIKDSAIVSQIHNPEIGECPIKLGGTSKVEVVRYTGR